MQRKRGLRKRKHPLKHKILILDAQLLFALPSGKEGENLIRKMVAKILQKLKMAELGKFEFYAAIDSNEPGYSFLQPITTSHISGHYFSKPKTSPHIHMDIYSCKHFNWKTILPLLDNFLHLGKWKGSFIQRKINGKRNYVDFSGKGDKLLSESKF